MNRVSLGRTCDLDAVDVAGELDAGSDVVDLLPAELTVLTGMGFGDHGDPGHLDARAKHYGWAGGCVPNPSALMC